MTVITTTRIHAIQARDSCLGTNQSISRGEQHHFCLASAGTNSLPNLAVEKFLFKEKKKS